MATATAPAPTRVDVAASFRSIVSELGGEFLERREIIEALVVTMLAKQHGFMLGPPGTDGTDSYVLGEINVSSVFPMPDEAPAEIARRVADRLRSKL